MKGTFGTGLLAAAAVVSSSYAAVQCDNFHLLVEDYENSDGHSEDVYGACDSRDMVGGKMYLQLDETTLDFGPGDSLVLDVAAPAATSMTARSRNYNYAHDDRPMAMPELNKQPRYKVVSAIERTPAEPQPTDDEREGRIASMESATDIRSLISVRMVYTDESPTYCDEACVRDGMWGNVRVYGGYVTGSTADLLSKSSYGKMEWPEEQGAVVSVDMEKAAPVGTCAYNDEMNIAMAKVLLTTY